MKKITFYLFLLAIVSPQLKAQVTNGLVAKYSFFGNANDEVGTNNGVVNGATLTSDRFGIPNRAYKFDGFSGNSINLGSNAVLKPTSCTISLWAYIDSTACYQTALNYQPFIVTTNSNVPNAYYEAFAMGYWIPQPQFLTVNYQVGASSGTPCFSPATILPKQWYHFVFSFDNDSMITYLNGTRICALAKSFTTTYDNGNVMLGQTSVPSKEAYLNGRLDDIRIYNRKLTPNEVDTLYNLPSVNPNSLSDLQQDNEIFVSIHENKLTIQSEYEVDQIRIIDLEGSTVQTFSPSQDGTYLLNLTAKGLYFCEVRLKNNRRAVSKILIN
jgi:hypothetical protein